MEGQESLADHSLVLRPRSEFLSDITSLMIVDIIEQIQITLKGNLIHNGDAVSKTIDVVSKKVVVLVDIGQYSYHIDVRNQIDVYQ